MLLCLWPELEYSSLWYLSTFSGPILACVFGSFLCLVPIHNVLEQPVYWYEDQLTRFAGSPVVISQMMIRAEHWSDFSFENKWSTYIFMEILCIVFYACMTFGYYFTWDYYFEYSQPMPMSLHLGVILLSLIVNVAIIYRFVTFMYILTIRIVPIYNCL